MTVEKFSFETFLLEHIPCSRTSWWWFRWHGLWCHHIFQCPDIFVGDSIGFTSWFTSCNFFRSTLTKKVNGHFVSKWMVIHLEDRLDKAGPKNRQNGRWFDDFEHVFFWWPWVDLVWPEPGRHEHWSKNFCRTAGFVIYIRHIRHSHNVIIHTDSPKSENIINVNNIHFSFKSVKYSSISNISQPNIFQTFQWFIKNSHKNGYGQGCLEISCPYKNILETELSLFVSNKTVYSQNCSGTKKSLYETVLSPYPWIFRTITERHLWKKSRIITGDVTVGT